MACHVEHVIGPWKSSPAKRPGITSHYCARMQNSGDDYRSSRIFNSCPGPEGLGRSNKRPGVTVCLSSTPLPLLSQSHDKELKIATNVKSPDALECTFSFNSFVIHKKSLPSLNYTIHIVLRSLACSQRNLETSEIVSINQLLAFSTLL